MQQRVVNKKKFGFPINLECVRSNASSEYPSDTYVCLINDTSTYYTLNLFGLFCKHFTEKIRYYKYKSAKYFISYLY